MLTTARTQPRTHSPRTSAAERTERPDSQRPDEGSLLMALLFTVMVSALCIAIMATVMVGLKKTENTRGFALSQQAADIALADALIRANMRLLTTSPATNSGTIGNDATIINWTWTATRTTDALWTIDVEARGKNTDRHFRSTLARTPVIQGTWSDTNGDNIRDNIRYTAKNNRYFGTGFYGAQNIDLGSSGTNAPIVDGYNGGRGLVGTSGNIDVSFSDFDIANMWNWKAADTIAARCTGTDCTTATFRKFEQSFQTDPLTQCTGPNQAVNWKSSSGVRLRNGDCYNSLTFDADYNFLPTTANQQAWIYTRSDVVINPGINVGVNRTTVFTKPTNWVIAIQGGDYLMGLDSMFSGAVYNPAGVCSADGQGAIQSTTWIGAAACSTFEAYGRVRLRYDGAMANVARPGDTTASPAVWNLRDFQIID